MSEDTNTRQSCETHTSLILFATSGVGGTLDCDDWICLNTIVAVKLE
jgi:hypothetical protein